MEMPNNNITRADDGQKKFLVIFTHANRRRRSLRSSFHQNS